MCLPENKVDSVINQYTCQDHLIYEKYKNIHQTSNLLSLLRTLYKHTTRSNIAKRYNVERTIKK